MMNLLNFKKAILTTAIVTAMSVSLTACNDSNDSDSSSKTSAKGINLMIGHINDHHSHLEAEGDQEFKMDGKTYEVERGGFARTTQLFKDFESAYADKNLLKLHAGDAMTGTVYYSFYKGKADADLMNTVCFDAFSLGNHEFDDSDENLKNFLDYLNAGSCKTPVLGANVVPQVGTPLAPKTATDYIKPYIVRETKEGVKVGIIGLDIASKTTKSSQPLATTKFLNETETAQKYIDELKEKGVKHIILLTHYTYSGDKKLAKALTGVDVIIGGDSHTLLGDFKKYGGDFGAKGEYPTITKNKDGETVCIGQAWEYTKAFGLMNVNFNENGTVKSCNGSAIIPVGGSFSMLNETTKKFEKLSYEENAAMIKKLSEQGKKLLSEDLILPVAENATAVNALKSYKDLISDKMNESIGKSSDTLCLVRVPGTTKSGDVSGCENSDKLARGSDIAQVVAQSFLEASKRADFALQNSGGVRTAISSGEITNKNAYDLLPFSNTLVNFDITGAQVKATLEDAISNHMEEDGSSGSHPYASGLRWDLDLSKAKGSRVTNLEVKDKASGQWSALDDSKTYVMVTNDYIGRGKDGYVTLGKISKDASKVEDTKLLYTQSFIDYVSKKGTITRPEREDYSHKSAITKDGTQLGSE